ncbi:MAG: hypothetical protein ACI4FO_06480 [Acutalibacteraceae bacterium]
MSFINFSNHTADNWSVEQKQAALEYGSIVDIPFPNVDPYATEYEISELADDYYEKIISMNPDCVMCSGEFTLTFAIINRLLKSGVRVVAACSERVAAEKTDENGSTYKESVFRFVKFREFKEN